MQRYCVLLSHSLFSLFCIVETFNQALTSSIFEAQIRKSPNIAQANNFSDYCQNELHLVGPLASVITLYWSMIWIVVICHQVLLLVTCWLHLDRFNCFEMF